MRSKTRSVPVETPVTAPDPGDKALQTAKERKYQRRYAQGGRAGTMLSNRSETLG